MLNLINEISELVYIIDTDTYDLLFVNEVGKKMFHLDILEGLKCYKALQGRDSPCPFCTNAIVTKDGFYIWELTNPVVNRHYLLKDKLILWEGKWAKVEIAFDITEKEQQNTALQEVLDAQKQVMNCVKMLNTTQNLPKALQSTLQEIGKFLGSDRVYLFEINGDHMDNTYEWCAKGITPQKGSLQGLDIELISRWIEFFDKRKCVIIEEVEALKEENMLEYEILHAQGISSLVAAPLEIDRKLIGYLGVDNPPLEKIKNVCSLLFTLGFFIAASMQRENNKKKLETLSYIDTLTGLQNRNAFERDTKLLEKKKKHSIGVIYLNINGLKKANDLYGHQRGDDILKDMGQKLCSIFQKNYVYRVGGDEFVVFRPGISAKKFEFLLKNFRRSIFMDNVCSVAIGQQWSESASNIRRLIFLANDMMYDDKKNFYRGNAAPKRYRSNNDDILGITNVTRLQKMLADEQFLVYFQPKFSVQDRQFIGAEALVRFQSQAGAIVSPDQFIPLLEETKLIPLVDFYVYEFVCKKISLWLKEGRQVVPVSVNFSRCSLADKDFVYKINSIWKKYHFSQKLIELEVTESVEEDNNYDFLKIIESVREKGFSVSIDDFGIKYANLSLFTTATFDVLKIDRSLILDLQKNTRAQAVLQSVTDICRRMNVQLIVEGVETEEQLKILQDINCYGVQGYLFSRPLSLADFEDKFINGVS